MKDTPPSTDCQVSHAGPHDRHGGDLLDKTTEISCQDGRFIDLKRQERHELRKRTNVQLSRKVARFDRKTATKIEQCGHQIKARRCQHGKVITRRSRSCKIRFCPVCGHVRSNKLVERYEPVVSDFAEDRYGYFLTLTLGRSWQLPARRDLSKWLRNFFRRKVWQPYVIEGGLYSVEVTYDQRKGFHVHIHALIFTKYPMQSHSYDDAVYNAVNQGFSDAWSAVTPNSSFIVCTKRWDGRIREMLKYLLKPADIMEMQDGDLRKLMEWTRGSRMLSAFGGLYGRLSQDDDVDDVDDDHGECGPDCSCKWDDCEEEVTFQFNYATGCYEPVHYRDLRRPLKLSPMKRE